MDAKFYRASLLHGETLAVSTHADCEDEWNATRLTTLHVCVAAEGGTVKSQDFFGASLGKAVTTAADALGFEFVNLSDPSGNVTRRHYSIQATDEQITFRAKLAAGVLSIHEADDDDEGDTTYLRLMSVEKADGSHEVFKGASLYACVDAVKRNLRVASVRVVKHGGGKDDDGTTEAQRMAGWA